MWQLSNITHTLPRKGNIWHIVFECVGEVLLKQWKQGNTWFGKTKKRPLEIGVFFLSNLLPIDTQIKKNKGACNCPFRVLCTHYLKIRWVLLTPVFFILQPIREIKYWQP